MNMIRKVAFSALGLSFCPRRNRLYGIYLIKVALALVIIVISVGRTYAAGTAPEIWIDPTDDVTQHGVDFHDYFRFPAQWHHAAASITRFSIPLRYLLVTPPGVVAQELSILRKLGLRLDVAVPAMPADKRVCGNGIEGTVWPGEPSSYSKKLKKLGIDVYSFSLDLPLIAGFFEKGRQSCHYSIRETAERTAHAVSDILAQYPYAKIVDVEVPTGVPALVWGKALTEWTSAYRQASGRNFDAFVMDAWWLFDWRSAAMQTVTVLAPLHIPVGIAIDASGQRNVPATDWISAAKRNFCNLKASPIRVDIIAVANWQNMQVRGLPESNPDTLTGLVDWLSRGGAC